MFRCKISLTRLPIKRLPTVHATPARRIHHVLEEPTRYRAKNGVFRTVPKPHTQFNRLAEHYRETLTNDLLVMTYDHKAAVADAKEAEALAKAQAEADAAGIELPPPEAPVEPKYFNEGRRNFKARVRYSPQPTLGDMNIPELAGISVSMYMLKAAENKFHLLNAFMLMQALTGTCPILTRSRIDNAQIKLRKEQPMGCKVMLLGDKMWDFLDRFILAFPRLKEFNGFPALSGNDTGAVTLRVDAEELSSFSELEVILDNVPQRCGFEVTFIVANSTTAARSRLLLSSLNLPFRKREDEPETIDQKEEATELYAGQFAREAAERAAAREEFMRTGARDAELLMIKRLKAKLQREQRVEAKKAKKGVFYDFLN